MRKIAVFMAMAACAACSYGISDQSGTGSASKEQGTLSVTIEHERVETKAQTDYTTVLDEEKAVNSIAVFVFDKASGILNSYKEIGSLSEECTFSVTTGEKTVYAVLNGPDLGMVTTVSQLQQIVDDLSGSEINSTGLVMAGSGHCNVEAGKIAEPVIIVRRLVSRVVLQKITNNVPPQYGSLTVDCVYLGNANTRQTISGTVSGKVNPDGYEDAAKTKPIGKNRVTGSCAGYLYRQADADISVGASNSTKYHMYCQPSGQDAVTCLYILATIGNGQYYYRVPFNNGLQANKTYSVEIEIVNLGSELPPDGDVQKGEIRATVTMAGWDAGDSYVIQF